MTKENTTKEGIEVKIGQVWRDLDKRMDRYGKVVAVDNGKASMCPCLASGRVISERISRVSIRRMHRNSTGWDLVKP